MNKNISHIHNFSFAHTWIDREIRKNRVDPPVVKDNSLLVRRATQLSLSRSFFSSSSYIFAPFQSPRRHQPPPPSPNLPKDFSSSGNRISRIIPVKLRVFSSFSGAFEVRAPRSPIYSTWFFYMLRWPESICVYTFSRQLSFTFFFFASDEKRRYKTIPLMPYVATVRCLHRDISTRYMSLIYNKFFN